MTNSLFTVVLEKGNLTVSNSAGWLPRKIQVRRLLFWVFFNRSKKWLNLMLFKTHDHLNKGLENWRHLFKFSKTVDKAIKDADEGLENKRLTFL